ncbi:oligosaccharide flippase family protein [Roseibacterium sp. SDUM158016]|uniref:oligosaccharide flippase family protein n=1 Tax=Roseicyclus sediminis TaxID=2980997 RepID=UPI0021CE2B21|nr:oligosaccharide flippase family protein [Roseibacterium sp. SDUM158016]MCU4654380.1 oligosaccharide flippase family protein [Roseibacterium sp. SDUM158016]
MSSALHPAPEAGGLAHLTTKRTRASVTGVAWNLATVAVASALALGVFLVTSRLLTPADFGAVALAVAIVAMVSMLVPVAFGEAVIQRAELRPDHLDSVFWTVMAVGVALFAALAFAAPAIADWTGTAILSDILPVLALRIPLDAAAAVPTALVARRMQFRYTALRSALANGVGAVVCIWLVLEGYALWALVVSQLVNAVVALVVTAWAARWRPGLRVRTGALAELRFFGLYAMGSRVLNQARLDQFALGLFLGAPVLGLFFFARRLFAMLTDLTAGAFGPVANVLMASLQAEPAKRRQAFHMASLASAGLAFPLFSGLALVAPDAVPLVFGPQWAGAVFPLQCFAVMGLLAGIGIVQSALIRNAGRPDWWFWYQAVVQLSTLLIIVALHPFGLHWIMAALAVRAYLLWPFSAAKARAMLGLGWGDYFHSLRAPALATLAMVPAVLLAGTADLPDGACLALQVASGAAAYGTVLALLARGEIREALSLIRHRKDAP